MVWKIVGRLRAAHAALNAVSVSLVGIVAAALVVASLLAAFEVIPWPQIALFFGGQAVPQAGMWARQSADFPAGTQPPQLCHGYA